MGFLKKFTKQEISWMMYDWANSAHSVIVVTILPIFFDTVAGYTADSVSSMSTWGFATSLAMAIVALSAPFLGVFGDIRGMRKKLFTAFMLIGVVSVAGLSFTPFMDFTASPDAAGRVAAIVLVLYITSTIGFDASCIYYDAFLTDVTTEDRMDSVSTLGYGLGYIGGSTIPLLIFLIMNAVGVPMLTCLGFIFGLTAVWWLVFSVPLVKNCEQTSGKPYKKGDVGASIKNVFTTMKEIGADKPMLIYIISYFFYIDGVHTIISMSTSYGTNLGLDSAGMLLALPLLPGDSDITVTGEAVSRPYVQMTLAVLARHGVTVEKITDGWHIPGGQFCRPAPLLDEPDWSAAAYWLVLRALLPRQRREALRIPLVPPPYLQGDAAILRYLDKLPEQIDISDTPDLLPPLALYAALRPGRDTRFTHAAFLRQKESDRLTAVSAVLNALGASAEVQPDGLVIHGVSALHGGDVSACGDHRIALLAGCAAMVADGPVTLSGAETVAKSYPAFWRELAALGGNWEVLES